MSEARKSLFPPPEWQISNAMAEWVDLFASRDEMAEGYALAMRSLPLAAYEFAILNHAIINRWSINGLEYIKRRAWKIAETGRA